MTQAVSASRKNDEALHDADTSELIGLETPEPVQGISLVPLVTGDTEDLGLIAYGESFYPRHHYGWSELKSVRDGALHYIDAPNPELFDVESDPLQKNNLARQRAATVRRMKTALDELVEGFGTEGIDEKGPETLDQETQAQLAALGYLGGASKVKIDPDRPLADPKDKIGLFNLIKAAGADSSAGNVAEAMEKIERVLIEDPDILEPGGSDEGRSSRGTGRTRASSSMTRTTRWPERCARVP